MRCNHVEKLYQALKIDCHNVMTMSAFSPYLGELTNDIIPSEEVEENVIPLARAAVCILAYYIPNSESFHQDQLLLAAKQGIEYYIEHTHSDGSQDLYYTNFHDPNQVGFHMYHFQCINYLAKHTTHTKLENEVFDLLVKGLRLCAKALCNLGFHTPNHRWIQTNGLYLCQRYVDDPKIKETIDKYLWEGIDCDENGEYTEKSAGIYNYVNNEAFIHMYMNTGNKEYLEYPRRNLKLTRSFFEPDRTINTMNSLRQDLGQQNIPSSKYYWQFLFVATALQDPDLAFTADKMYEEEICHGVNYSGLFLYTFLEQLGDFENLIKNCPSKLDKDDYSICLPNSGVARKYFNNNEGTVTICKSRGFAVPDCFKIQVNNNSVYGRFSGDFFGKPHSQFHPNEFIENEDGSVTLISNEEQGYRSQFDEKPNTSVWRHMDHSKRRWINIQKFTTAITFKVENNIVSIDIDSTGVEGVCCKFELAFNVSPAAKLITSGGEILACSEGRFIPDSNCNYFYSDSGLLFKIRVDKPHGHTHVQNERGAAPPLVNRYKLDFPQRNPYKQHIEIEVIKNAKLQDAFKLD